jgi:hypothetical protein
MKRLVLLATLVLAACSSTQGPAVPSISAAGGSSAQAGSGAAPVDAGKSSSMPRPQVGYSATRVQQLHGAAQCIRAHGVASYQDPVLTADGHVYSDARSVQDATAKMSAGQADAFVAQLRQACGALFTAAGMQPDAESPAPPQLVRAGVRSAQCLRAHGLPDMRDPDSQTAFTPGHGFGMSADELPNNGALGKQDPTVQRAFTACRSVLDAEIRASSLERLSHD